MKRCVIIFILSFICILFLSGCVTNYTRDDIEQYVHDTIGISDFRVSYNYQTVIGKDDYHDRIWTITDQNTGIRFHVIDDYSWGMESMTNTLKDDYTDAVLNYIRSDLPSTSRMYVETNKNNGIYSSKITGSFKNSDELKVCYDELLELKESISRLGYSDLSAWFCLSLEHPLRNNTDNEIIEGDTSGRTDNIPSYQDMLDNYVLTVLNYRYDGTLESITPVQIADALEDCPERVGIIRDPSSNTYEFYDDIVADPYYGISFGSLYEILLREGLQPAGTPSHYTFTGTDGAVYEISYDFNNYPFSDSSGISHLGYYYIKSGEKVPMSYYFYNCFTTDEIFQMTGLKVTDHSGDTL